MKQSDENIRFKKGNRFQIKSFVFLEFIRMINYKILKTDEA